MYTRAIVNTLTMVGGCISLSLALGWGIGIGITLLVIFHKEPERM